MLYNHLKNQRVQGLIFNSSLKIHGGHHKILRFHLEACLEGERERRKGRRKRGTREADGSGDTLTPHYLQSNDLHCIHGGIKPMNVHVLKNDGML